MRKSLKKICVGLITSSLVLSTVSVSSFATGSEEYKRQIDSIKNEQSQTKSEVGSLESQLQDLIASISETEEALVKKGEEVLASQKELEKAEKVEKKQYKLMKTRIVYMYESGNKQLVDKLFESESLSDLLTRYEYIEQISDSDKKVFDEYVEAKEQVKAATEKLQEEQAELEQKEKEYQTKQEEVTNLLESKKAEIADLDSQLSAATQAYEQAKVREAAQRAAAAQRTAESQRAAASSYSSNSSSSYSGASSSVANDNAVPQVSGNTVVNRALSQLGKPYVWGACGPNAFDCSGLVSYALTGRYARIGTSGTFGSMTRVSNPQPGDIVCYPGHVAIYYGGGKQIEAQQSGVPILVSNVRGGAWYTRY